MKTLDIKKGYKFGNFTVVEELERGVQPSGITYRRFKCICVCGNYKNIRAAHLVRKNINSCGCLRACPSLISESDKYIRKIWRAIQYRCGSKYMESNLYYDKGVRVCDLWLNNYDQFKKWALDNGLKKGLHIDRIDGDKGYEPNNCRVVTPLVNANNRVNSTMIEYKGELVAISLLLHRLGKHYSYAAIRGRIKRGWDIEKAIDTPIRGGNYYKGP